MAIGVPSAASSHPARPSPRSPAHPTISTCSSPETTAASTPPGGSTASTGQASTTTGVPSAAPVAALSRKPDHLDLVVNGNDDRAYTSWWVNVSDWSGIKDNWMLI